MFVCLYVSTCVFVNCERVNCIGSCGVGKVGKVN